MNQRGQMAIFIALIFQVLFIFFAMAINIALVVHDKINLQNAVDLAAYYAASKQAEILNVVAHENYMIRQSWKLLSFRYRVVGMMGLQNPPHPLTIEAAQEDQLAPDSLAGGAVCVAHNQWQNINANESLCHRPYLAIPPLPRVRAVFGAPTDPLNAIFASLSEVGARRTTVFCEKYGAYNWWFAMLSMQAFREDQKNRKKVIRALVENLVSEDPLDLDGDPISAGARKTFEKNLTFSNASSAPEFRFINPLKGYRYSDLFSEIKALPTLMYADPKSGLGCTLESRDLAQLPDRPSTQDIIRRPYGPQGLGAEVLAKWHEAIDGEILTDDQIILGVEKNPWIMVYSGVAAESTPRPVFFPFGQAVRLKAQGLAKPFGGQVGPWYGRLWQKGAKASDASDLNLRLDPLLPPRLDQNPPSSDQEVLKLRLPNFSRYPGDPLGYKSLLAMSSFINLIRIQPNYDWFRKIWVPMGPGSLNDVVAFAPDEELASPEARRLYELYRDLELAAIAPDLFDITYYSIEPEFGKTYYPRLKGSAVKFGLGPDTPIRGDLGSNHLQNKIISVRDHVAASVRSQPRPEAYFWVRKLEHLLTGWVPSNALYDYSTFPAVRFGKCGTPDDRFEEKIPGACVSDGGRVGYSVKMISRSYLSETMNGLGGVNTSGTIENPPSDDF